MTSSRSVLYVHFNGRMTYGENGVGYEGNDVKLIQVNNDITFFELKRRLITALQLANQAQDIKITYQYPQVSVCLFIYLFFCVLCYLAHFLLNYYFIF